MFGSETTSLIEGLLVVLRGLPLTFVRYHRPSCPAASRAQRISRLATLQ